MSAHPESSTHAAAAMMNSTSTAYPHFKYSKRNSKMHTTKITNRDFEPVDPLMITNGASLAAIGLHLLLAQWSAQSLSDGFLPLYIVDQIGAEDLQDELVANGIWTRTEDGFHIAGWHHEQESEAAVLGKREVAAERVRRHRAKLAGVTVLAEVEPIITEVEVTSGDIREEAPVRVVAATRTRSRVTEKAPEPELQPEDLNFDEFLDLMQTPPEDDKTCWAAWVKVNKMCETEDILNAADDYQMRVPRRQRMLPEEWLSEHEYLRCSPFNEPWEPK